MAGIHSYFSSKHGVMDIDTGASHHMTASLNTLNKLMGTDSPSTVRLPNGNHSTGLSNGKILGIVRKTNKTDKSYDGSNNGVSRDKDDSNEKYSSDGEDSIDGGDDTILDYCDDTNDEQDDDGENKDDEDDDDDEDDGEF
ncbi:pheromone-processing carboxypeptidase KEX1-like [Pistacia vera]|uniref:pheromone-processing carboxypeptidase KEX1-like n=1 Tax=Pistacia vera TaxID=55513 RepID=UPI001262C123|nr:pheromone-processing carboxypeptidase KEX1-like [Pistacia vera]